MGVGRIHRGPDRVEIQIEGLAAGGRGVGRVGGVVWFVAGGLPGDRILAEAHRRHARYVEGRLVERVASSPERRSPRCPIQESCGGCPWMALTEESQHGWKRRLIEEALARIGKSAPAVDPVRRTRQPLGYRNKAEFTLGRDRAGRPVVGLHARGPGAPVLVDVPECPVQSVAADAVLRTAREFLLAREGWADATPPFRLVLRTSFLTGEVLVGLREVARPFPFAEALAGYLTERHVGLVGVVRIRAREARRGGARVVPLRGRPWIEERIGGTCFRLPAATFLQVNTEGADLLVELVREAAGPVAGRTVLDLYGGVGPFGIDLARRGASVTVVEADAEAVRCGRSAARAAGVRGVRHVHDDVEAFLGRGADADLAVADPPRTGLGRRVSEGIAALSARRVVLVSCDPATLARDVGRLAAAGFAVERVVPVDLFPQTAHVECVVTLGRG